MSATLKITTQAHTLFPVMPDMNRFPSNNQLFFKSHLEAQSKTEDTSRKRLFV